jgi:hypothetical protein
VEDNLKKKYWLWQAENTYAWSVLWPKKRWEAFMYLYLFKWAGYEDE